jgi:hypothetical protein
VTIAELDARVRKYFVPDPAAQVKARRKLKRDDEEVEITLFENELN